MFDGFERPVLRVAAHRAPLLAQGEPLVLVDRVQDRREIVPQVAQNEGQRLRHRPGSGRCNPAVRDPCGRGTPSRSRTATP
ncbi:MAG: hypothetical protein ACK55I_47975, partial [bacterium]